MYVLVGKDQILLNRLREQGLPMLLLQQIIYFNEVNKNLTAVSCAREEKAFNIHTGTLGPIWGQFCV